MRDPLAESELARRFHETAASTHPRAPLYSALGRGISQDRELYELLYHAPITQRLPVLLFACTHMMLLAEPDHDLARWYPNLTEHPRSPDDPALLPTFKAFVQERAATLKAMLATRTTQTNEVGRCLMLLPAMGMVAAEVGNVAMLDVGASGGLNLLLDQYQYRYTADVDGNPGDTSVVGADSPVVLESSVRGPLHIPTEMPTITARCGIDIKPIDVTDDGEAHWLEACVWPDQRERFLRLRAAIGIARDAPPELLAGDAVSSLATPIERMALMSHPVVTNSWVLNYLTPDERTAYVAELDRIGATTDFSWIYVEAPAMTQELPWDVNPEDPHLTMVALARWRNGTRSVQYLATCHPHGFWIHAHG